MKSLTCVVLIVLTLSLYAQDTKMAEGLASTGADLVGKGKLDKGKDLLFRAFAYDSNCPTALYELGKVFEAEGNLRAAGDFFARASQELARCEKDNPSFGSKLSDVRTRLQKINPYATQYNQLMEEYAGELLKITRKVSDTMTAEEASQRVERLNLASVLPKEKLPATVAPRKPGNQSTTTQHGERDNGRCFQERQVVTSVPPDVERALKAAGWTTITGTWKKKAERVYEVTDGTLEAPMLNGAIQVLVHKGNTGIVAGFVRARKDSCYYWDDDYRLNTRGYGISIRNQNAKIFAPTGYCGGTYSPWVDHEVALPDANSKNLILVQVQETKLDITLNTKKEKSANYPIGKEGSFIVSIEGSATIEAPQAAGK